MGQDVCTSSLEPVHTEQMRVQVSVQNFGAQEWCQMHGWTGWLPYAEADIECLYVELVAYTRAAAAVDMFLSYFQSCLEHIVCAYRLVA